MKRKVVGRLIDGKRFDNLTIGRYKYFVFSSYSPYDQVLDPTELDSVCSSLQKRMYVAVWFRNLYVEYDISVIVQVLYS